MTMANILGKLEQVDLRIGWTTEAGGFTPWLAREENISLLGETIEIDLEVEAQEKNVGPFRADILCKDTATGHWVLIENQLERTDHSHLGQLMTYAAGLNAVTIVWIAARFAEERRAAIDWLNEITDEQFHFFGLEVELWRIGDSPPAPKFNVICKPNDWSRSVTQATQRIDSADLSETRRLQLEFWQGLCDMMRERGGPVRPTKPLPQYWMNLSIGRTNFGLQDFVNARDGRIGVNLWMGGDDAKPHFHLLLAQKIAIEAEFGESLEWDEMPDKVESHIRLRWHDCDLGEREHWLEYHRWMSDTLQKFHNVFAQRIKQLNAAAHNPAASNLAP